MINLNIAILLYGSIIIILIDCIQTKTNLQYFK